jgi:hypothetical protein
LRRPWGLEATWACLFALSPVWNSYSSMGIIDILWYTHNS